jgi:hypothetical protein
MREIFVAAGWVVVVVTAGDWRRADGGVELGRLVGWLVRYLCFAYVCFTLVLG